jgi:signal peptidase I
MRSHASPPAEEAQPAHAAGDRRVFRRAALFGFLLFLAVFPFVPSVGPIFRLFSVPSTSMAPAISLGQFVLASRAAYGYSRHSFDLFELPIKGRWPAGAPTRGDVIVFRLPRDPDTFYIKRVIGLPGDRVQMIAGRLWLNGKAVARESAGTMTDPSGDKGAVPVYFERLPNGTFYRIVETDGDHGMLDNTEVFDVPEGRYFVLGDNRDNSADSRIGADKSGVGYVPAELILGPVVTSF